MKRWLKISALGVLCLMALPYPSPAPLTYTPGEGWTYEMYGGEGNWRKSRARDQLAVAQAAFDKKDFSLARKAALRVVKTWPLSDYAPQAEYLVARCFEAAGLDETAFKEYQKLLEKYPKAANYEDVLRRQFAICNRFLAGERFKLWNYIPTFRSMDKTVDMLDTVVKNGPYSDVAPLAQMSIGAAREKQTRFLNDKEPFEEAAKAYEVAADRYQDRPALAADALFKEGQAYEKQAETAEYDQSTAEKAINTYGFFKDYYPDDPRTAKCDQSIALLRTEQARGNFEIAKFYEAKHAWKGALIYYNEVLIRDPKSPYATTALQRITALKKLTETPAK